MKALSIARKTILEYLREPLLIGLLIAFPIMLLLFYYVAFGETEEGMAKHLQVLVDNQDQGPLGDQLVQLVSQQEFEGAPVFNLQTVTKRPAAENTLREGKAALLLEIPADFSQLVMSGAAGGQAAVVSLVGFPNSYNFLFAQSYLEDLIKQLASQAAGITEPLPPIDYEFVEGTGTMSDFDFGVAGLLVFATMFLTISTAMTMVREDVGNTLARLRLSAANARDLLVGVTLAQMLLALIIVPVTFGAALLFGFQANGSLWIAMGVTLLLSLAAVGLGLVTACFARNDGEAANLGATVGVLMVLVSGAMYPMPSAPLVTIGGRTIQLYDLLPPTHASEAMRRVLIYGDGIDAITFELAAMTVLASVTLGLGIALYQRLRLRRI